MKYLQLREFETVANALNFSTQDCHVIGGCDVYTTKAAGGDKKLYREIENTLESQHESLLRLSASLSPPCRTASDDGKDSDKSDRKSKRGLSVEVLGIDLSRASPFGPLSQITARRTFAYLIATLNAAHPDYDFSHILRPADFRKESGLRAIMQNVDSTLQNMRPRRDGDIANKYLSPPSTLHAQSVPLTRDGTEIWNPRMWTIIDKVMDLRRCLKYTYAPDDDPFDGEEGAIWSMHYFFFNKAKKRVCYLHLRCLSVISHSPVHAPAQLKRWANAFQRKASSVSIGEGAGKRASYWFGSIDTESYGEDDDDEMIIGDPDDDDEVDVPYMDLDDMRSELADGYRSYDVDDCEEIGATMEV